MRKLNWRQFHAKQFSPVYESLNGEDLFYQLNSKPVLSLLGAAALLRVDVASVFNVHFKGLYTEREKQFAGFVIRQIMEKNGFVIDRTGVPARVSGQMSRGSRYKLK